MRILIIEDDKNLAQLTKLALEKENFNGRYMSGWCRGRSFYYMQENMYDLVLLDRMLPSMDGTQVLEKKPDSPTSQPCYFPYGTWRITGQSQRIELRSR